MSAVIERIVQRRDKIAAKVGKGLDDQPFSKMMRSGTWSDHGRAEFSPFEQSLVKGTVTREAYRELMAQMWFVYDALESRTEELANDPVAGPVMNPGLTRLPAVEADLEFYYGPGWRDQIYPMSITFEYVYRIRNATPAQFVAHHYTRYLADLSGGVQISQGVTAAFGLNVDGVRFYIFDQIGDPMAFKVEYRAALDGLPLNRDEKLAVIEEVALAYEFNIEMVNDLSTMYEITVPA